jgi:hypothetical protein
MDPRAILSSFADIASIATAIVAVTAYSRYHYDRFKKRVDLENHLKSQAANAQGRVSGLTILELVADLGMSESEIMDAALRSRHIRRTATREMYGVPSKILLQFKKN